MIDALKNFTTPCEPCYHAKIYGCPDAYNPIKIRPYNLTVGETYTLYISDANANKVYVQAYQATDVDGTQEEIQIAVDDLPDGFFNGWSLRPVYLTLEAADGSSQDMTFTSGATPTEYACLEILPVASSTLNLIIP